MAPQIEASPFTPQVIRGLSDKLYEKRKAAALDVERLIRDSLLASDHGRVSLILTALIDDFAYSSLPNARNGGLIALAAAAIALGTAELCRHLDAIVPPILSCFTDQDSRVRYYACESMYNVAKVARGDILKYFNEVFDALSKLSSDAEPSVKNGAELLDRLMKDIVSERAIFWAPDQKDAGPESDQTGNELSAELSPIPTVSTYPAVPGTVPLRPGMKPTQFNLPRFIPLLAERIHTLAPFTRTFLVQWISVLDSVPDLELIAFLPDFLDGLFNYLSDPNIDVRVATLNVLGEFLKEIRDVLVTQRERGVLRIRGKTSKPPARHRRDGSDVSVSFANLSVESNQRPPEQVSLELPSEIPPSLQPDHPIALSSDELQPPHTSTRREGEPPNRTDSNNNESLPYIPGLGVVLDIGRMTEILIPHLMSTDEETQATSLRWINEFIILAREVILPFTPMLLNAILPSLAHSVASIKSVASETNSSLYKLILDLPTTAIAPRDGPGESGAVTTVSLPSGGYDLAAHTPAHLDNIDLDASVETLTLQFQDEREDTRVAALEWLLMLHKKAPMEVLCSDDPTFQALLRTLSDSSEEVVKRDLQLLAQVSQHSDDEYFTRFMVNLLSLFSTDRRLLETRGSLIIRQLCLSLNPERMYRTFAEIIEREEDLEFASTMVQNLNFILITAPELSELRRRLKNLDSRDGILLFTALYRSWCHNAVAVFSLCLLAQAYEHASNLLTLFADLEITVNLLIQIDKLVQLLESPVFTYLRLQLLEPDRYPHLFKCLYGILMLLPQSSAFATLRNRLNSVSSMVFMFSGGGAGGALLMNVSTSSGSSQTEPQTRNGFSALGLRRSKPPGISPGPSPTTSPESTPPPQMRWNDLLQQFRHVQARHERSRRIGARTNHPSMDRTSSSGFKRRNQRARTDESPHRGGGGSTGGDDFSTAHHNISGGGGSDHQSQRERSGSFNSSSRDTVNSRQTVSGAGAGGGGGPGSVSGRSSLAATGGSPGRSSNNDIAKAVRKATSSFNVHKR